MVGELIPCIVTKETWTASTKNWNDFRHEENLFSITCPPTQGGGSG